MAHIPKFYDVVIIGAGPAGLSAACTTRRLGLDTLLLEQLPQSGELGHPCGSTIAPVPGFVAGERRQDGLHYPELDLTIPSSLLIGFPTTQRYISPGGYEMRVVFPARDDFPIAAVDKPGLLRLLAEQAIGAGVELCFGTVVTGLIAEGNRIVGVRTEAEEIRAQIILSAEGTTRRFCQEAGLYDAAPPTRCHVAIVWQELEAPGVRDEHVGKIATFGERYTSATRVVGTVDMPAAGYAAVYLSFFGTGPYEGNEELSWDYLEEYKRTDPRVQDLLVGSTVVRRRRCRLVVRDAPPRVVQAGFMGLGDAVTPGGRLGIVPSLYVGQRAARVAADAVFIGDVSTEQLAPYDDFLHGPFLRGLGTEDKIVHGLVGMADEEINRVCRTFSKTDLSPFFFGKRWPRIRESVKGVARGFPLIVRDRKLISRLMAGGPECGSTLA